MYVFRKYNLNCAYCESESKTYKMYAEHINVFPLYLANINEQSHKRHTKQIILHLKTFNVP